MIYTKVPFNGTFKITQTMYSSFSHKNLGAMDFVGVTSKTIYAPIEGTVEYAGWENAKNKKQGFGVYVRIKGSDGNRHYLAHMKEGSLKVKAGSKVTYTTALGTMGSTGYSTGAHTHYEIRKGSSGTVQVEVAKYTGLPNKLGTYYAKDYTHVKEDKPVVKYLANKSYKGSSIVEALKKIKVDSSYAYRVKLAAKNGIKSYKGTASQNTKMLNLLKTGKLIKA